MSKDAWSGADSREPTFDQVRRGYDPKQVLAYVKRMTDRVRILEERAWGLEADLEAARARGKTPPLSDPTDPYENVSDRVAEVVRSLDQNVERIRLEAEAEAKRITEEAEAAAERGSQEGERLREEGKAAADRMLVDARAEADRIRLDAQANAEEMRAEVRHTLERTQGQTDAVLSELESRRKSVLAELRALHDRMLDSATDLEPILEGEEPPEQVVVPEDEVVIR